MFATHSTKRSDEIGEPSFDSQANESHPRVLVVESIRSTRELLGLVLEGQYNTTSVATYEEALQYTASTQFDAVLMSVNLSRVEAGIETLKEIRARPEYQDVPIIVVIGPSLDTEQERLREAGGDAFLRMPFVRSDLLDLLSRHVSEPDRTS